MLEKNDLESLNYWVAYFNWISKTVKKNFMDGIKERAMLVPEFMEEKT